MNTKGHHSDAMLDHRAEVIRLLRLAQAGQPEQALAETDGVRDSPGCLGFLYVRAVAMHCLGNRERAVRAAERMLAVAAGHVGMVGTTEVAASGGASPAEQAETAAWWSVALSFRACQLMLLSELAPQALNLESTLHDLAQAETALTDELTDDFLLAAAHTGIGHGYHNLRLYELARPQYEAAFDVATKRAATVAVEAAITSQLNLAEMHLNWSVELQRIGDGAGARETSGLSAHHAALAQQYASTEATQAYAAQAALLAACAASVSRDNEQVVDQIRAALRGIEGRASHDGRAFALPFLAMALDEAGQHTEALEVAAQAGDVLPEDATWLQKSAAYHTQATLLARSGSDYARVGLAYGDQLAKTMWRNRLRTLHNARSMQYLERVTLERDRVQVLAHTDALTGIGNRRAFDALVEKMSHATGEAATREVAVIVVDVDGLKEVNDAEGHAAGDLTLKAVAVALSSQARPEDLVARIGGDEFVVVVPGLAPEDAGGLARRLVDATSSALRSKVTVSVGVATGAPARLGSEVLRAADQAMYEAKRANR